MNRILLLDTSAVLHAVKYSLGKHRLSHREKPTFVIYGFLLKLQLLLRKTHANIVVYAIDRGTKSLRADLYPKYKEKRHKKKTEEQIELDRIAYPQFEEIINFVIPTLGYRNVFGAEGYEADDIIGRICKDYRDEEKIICTSDQDMYQLLNSTTCIIDAKKNSYYSDRDFRRDYGIEPKMWKRVKAIGGCSSDEIKGVPIFQPDPNKKQMHVAEKGALNFIKGNMGKNTRAYQSIVSKEGIKVIRRNKKLVILPFEGTPHFRIRPDHPKERGLRIICEKYGFNSILDDMRTWRKVLRLR